ncbi:solute carrier family 35 member G1-like isoform X4 [Apostichopus japonicus]|uniref:solute carrier family 35 member G1-like isoform X4 n=1 Tax=Stichopus japonicus TaxID=307972 RepID=UPI003AB70889
MDGQGERIDEDRFVVRAELNWILPKPISTVGRFLTSNCRTISSEEKKSKHEARSMKVEEECELQISDGDLLKEDGDNKDASCSINTLRPSVDPDSTHPEAIHVDRFTVFRRRSKGILFALLSAVFYSGQAFQMDIAVGDLGPFLVAFLMAIVMTGCATFLLVRNNISRPKTNEQYAWLLIAGLAMSAYLTLFSLALRNLDVGDTVTITYLSLILVGFVSWALLKEPFGLFDMLCAVVALTGVIFIVRPPFIFGNFSTINEHHNSMVGIAFAVAASIVISLIVTALRKHALLGIHAFQSLFTSGVIILVVSAVMCSCTGQWHRASCVSLIHPLGAGFAYFLGQLFLYYALQYERATLVNIFLTLEIVFAYAWQLLFLQGTVWWTSYVGATLVILSCVGMKVTRAYPATGVTSAVNETNRAKNVLKSA